MSEPPKQPDLAKPKRGWLRFTLRTLLILTALVAVWLGIQVNKVRKQRAAVAAIEALGGEVYYESSSPEESLIAKFVGPQFTADANTVSLSRLAISDNDLAVLPDMPNTEWLMLNGSTFPDAAFEHVKPLDNLLVLDLTESSITDVGLKNVRPLEKLLYLKLSGTWISDAGLEHLKEIDSLERVELDGCRVTAGGIAAFKQSRPDVEVVWSKPAFPF